ncbi:MAG: hypothetical protein JXA23_03040, partial [Bacteroidales bacterium]|nr:hypothetical protein [Bacteroidales bacterium]
MKEKEGFVDCPEQQMILYVEKEDGEFGPMQTGSYITKNFLDDYFDKRNNLIHSLREQIDKREISPVKFFMVLEDLTIKELSARTQIPVRKVKKHLLPGNFTTLSSEFLKRYSSVFNVSLEQLQKADASTKTLHEESTKP